MRIGLGLIASMVLLSAAQANAQSIVAGLSPSANENERAAQAAFAEKDWVSALSLFRQAAQEGDATASYYLGLMYEDGDGVEPDKFTALAWYRIAASRGSAPAQDAMAPLERYVQQVEREQQAPPHTGCGVVGALAFIAGMGTAPTRSAGAAAAYGLQAAADACSQ